MCAPSHSSCKRPDDPGAAELYVDAIGNVLRDHVDHHLALVFSGLRALRAIE